MEPPKTLKHSALICQTLIRVKALEDTWRVPGHWCSLKDKVYTRTNYSKQRVIIYNPRSQLSSICMEEITKLILLSFNRISTRSWKVKAKLSDMAEINSKWVMRSVIITQASRRSLRWRSSKRVSLFHMRSTVSLICRSLKSSLIHCEVSKLKRKKLRLLFSKWTRAISWVLRAKTSCMTDQRISSNKSIKSLTRVLAQTRERKETQSLETSTLASAMKET